MITKEEIVELIGMADILEAKLKELGMSFCEKDASGISYCLRQKLNSMCGEDYLKSLRKS